VATIQTAIQNLATIRANNGAEQSRLTFAADMLAVNKTNLEAANSRILDVDVADESTKLGALQHPAASRNSDARPGEPIEPIVASIADVRGGVKGNFLQCGGVNELPPHEGSPTQTRRAREEKQPRIAMGEKTREERRHKKRSDELVIRPSTARKNIT
jgi:hypothetical protein